MSLKAPPILVTVMAGYAKGNVLTPLAQRWIKALRLISEKIIIVFDQDHLDPWPDVITIRTMLRLLLNDMEPMILALSSWSCHC